MTSENNGSDKRAVVAISAACALNAILGAGFFYARRIDPSFSPESGVLIRIAANCSLFLLPLKFRGAGTFRLPKKTERDLWFWAVLGAMTVWTYFFSVVNIGAGATNLLNAGSGVLVVALAPIITGQTFQRTHLGCALGCLIGMILFTGQSSHTISSGGLALGVLSGAFSALAYLMVARTRRSFSPMRVVIYWTWLNVLIGLGLLLFSHLQWPKEHRAWMALIIAGLAAAASQYLTAYAYQRTHASLLACISYLAPALSLMMDAILFDYSFSRIAILGVGTTLFFSMLPPLLAQKRPSLKTIRT